MNIPEKIETIDVFEAIMDILEKHAEEPKDDEQKLKIYKDAFYEVTQGKFELMGSEEMFSFVKEGRTCGQSPIKDSEDIEAARQMIKVALEDIEVDSQILKNILLCTTEATTNVIKHAKVGGVEIKLFDGEVRIIVKDSGPGIETDELPHSVFLKGYSTSNSLGYGFSIMYKYTDKIYMTTSSDGTFLALEFKF